jgi:hypothetical protein
MDDNAHDVDHPDGDNDINISVPASYLSIARCSPPPSDPSPSHGAQQAPLTEVQGHRTVTVIATNTSLGRPVVVCWSSSLACRTMGGRPGRRPPPPPAASVTPPSTSTGMAACRIPIHLCLGPREEVVGHVPIQKYAQGTAGGRIPVHLWLEPWVPDTVMHQPCRRGLSPPDAEGWSEVLPRQVSGTPRPRSAAPQQNPTPWRSLPAQLDGRCLNSLSYSHCQATCTHPTRCLRCFNLQHIARDYKYPCKPPTNSNAIGAARSLQREVRHHREVFSVAMPHSSNVATPTPREDVTSWECAGTGPTPSPLPSCSAPPPPQLDATVVCSLLQRNTSIVGASDPWRSSYHVSIRHGGE